MSNKHCFVEDYPWQEAGGRNGLSIYWLACRRTALLDVAELVKRLGPDHGCLHWDLVKVIDRHECRAAGRDDRNLQFTNHALTPEQRKGWTPRP
ncbi:hypothetical protein [Mesorhizobium sp.]|uniref:hypothetical protein n=1 Tax=Mesorhizobium sp. TaxID=1871066 RepID=UPI000FE6DC0B|nr:hypothetical protein [Mesorhizobium sp.]RWG07735.1 MAG: hypothetical protein EOQ54_02240 [Mesorhizobium sp.]RWH02951.1 MAG: hypothetical protein EOQ72_04050 [Mesorhizobium sp.]TIN37892.1 MAG: hypothetical protein E5Y25_22180 [Mesorhizobium sp.]TIR89101.1 MAG: hypothetical protein E5X08_28985 [Mesorhizobium sp.]TIS03893.1 MAG: hypothetical protein E5X13_03905 [Mesorhizobium sp.]